VAVFFFNEKACVCPAHSLPHLAVEWVKELATPKGQEAFLPTPAFYRNFRPTLGQVSA
jgi:hypothetical protein